MYPWHRTCYLCDKSFKKSFLVITLFCFILSVHLPHGSHCQSESTISSTQDVSSSSPQSSTISGNASSPSVPNVVSPTNSIEPLSSSNHYDPSTSIVTQVLLATNMSSLVNVEPTFSKTASVPFSVSNQSLNSEMLGTSSIETSLLPTHNSSVLHSSSEQLDTFSTSINNYFSFSETPSISLDSFYEQPISTSSPTKTDFFPPSTIETSQSIGSKNSQTINSTSRIIEEVNSNIFQSTQPFPQSSQSNSKSLYIKSILRTPGIIVPSSRLVTKGTVMHSIQSSFLSSIFSSSTDIHQASCSTFVTTVIEVCYLPTTLIDNIPNLSTSIHIHSSNYTPILNSTASTEEFNSSIIGNQTIFLNGTSSQIQTVIWSSEVVLSTNIESSFSTRYIDIEPISSDIINTQQSSNKPLEFESSSNNFFLDESVLNSLLTSNLFSLSTPSILPSLSLSDSIQTLPPKTSVQLVTSISEQNVDKSTILTEIMPSESMSPESMSPELMFFSQSSVINSSNEEFYTSSISTSFGNNVDDIVSTSSDFQSTLPSSSAITKRRRRRNIQNNANVSNTSVVAKESVSIELLQSIQLSISSLFEQSYSSRPVESISPSQTDHFISTSIINTLLSSESHDTGSSSLSTISPIYRVASGTGIVYATVSTTSILLADHTTSILQSLSTTTRVMESSPIVNINGSLASNQQPTTTTEVMVSINASSSTVKAVIEPNRTVLPNINQSTAPQPFPSSKVISSIMSSVQIFQSKSIAYCTRLVTISVCSGESLITSSRASSLSEGKTSTDFSTLLTKTELLSTQQIESTMTKTLTTNVITTSVMTTLSVDLTEGITSSLPMITVVPDLTKSTFLTNTVLSTFLTNTVSSTSLNIVSSTDSLLATTAHTVQSTNITSNTMYSTPITQQTNETTPLTTSSTFNAPSYVLFTSHFISASELQPTVTNSKISELLVSVSTSQPLQPPASTTITTQPPPTASPISNQTLIELTVVVSDQTVDVTSNAFEFQMEFNLARTYLRAQSIIQRRKRRAATAGTVTVEIINQLKRNATNPSDVKMQFQVQDNNQVIPANQAVSTLNVFSESGLQKNLGYPVTSPAQMAATGVSTPDQQYLLAILLNKNILTNDDKNQFKKGVADYYVQEAGNPRPEVEIIDATIKLEQPPSYTYLQFCLKNGNEFINASQAVQSYFPANKLVTFNGLLNPLIAVNMPYPAAVSYTNKKEYMVRMKLKPPINTNLQTFRDSLLLKISGVYLIGKHQVTRRRRRRAAGSVDTKILAFIGSSSLVEVAFELSDRGSNIKAVDVASTMNKVSNMASILGAEIVLAPEALFTATTNTPDDLRYWIIGVVGGVVLMIFLVMGCVCWRWKRGGPANEGRMKIVKVDGGEDGDEVDAGEKETPPESAEEAADESVVSKKDALSLPLFSKDAKHFTNSDLRTSQRRKVNRSSLKPNMERQNAAYDPSVHEIDEDESEEEEESEYETDDEEQSVAVSSRAKTPPQKPPRRHLNYTPDSFKSRSRSRTPPRARTPPSVPNRKADARRPLEMTGNVLYNEKQGYTADQVPTFSYMNDSKDYKTNPPLRFRHNIDVVDAYAKPNGPLPMLNLQQTSLVGNSPRPMENPPRPTNPDDDHKTEVERMRNKQRQRDQMFAVEGGHTSTMTSSMNNNSSWRKEQEKINAILDPQANDLRQRKGRLRRKMRRNKNKISMLPMKQSFDERGNRPNDIELKSFSAKNSHSPVLSRSRDKLYQDETSEPESELSMREAKRRIHSLLDDTFSSLKKYQKQLGKDEVEANKSSPPQPPSRENTLRRHAGMTPTLPGPPPAHGRASTTPPGNKKRTFQPATPNPYMMPQYPQYPAYHDPLLTWDPMERQRYINQRMGYPGMGYQPSLAMPYGAAPGQNVYVTPVQQRPDGMGGMLWSPYAAPHKEGFGQSVPGESPTKQHFDLFSSPTAHNTTIDLNDIGSLKKDSSSQPLIRAIKGELLKLSHSKDRKNRVQELNPSESNV